MIMVKFNEISSSIKIMGYEVEVKIRTLTETEVGSNIWESRDEFDVMWVVVVSHGTEGSSLGGGDEGKNGSGCQEFH
jgi:hypothetical protein